MPIVTSLWDATPWIAAIVVALVLAVFGIPERMSPALATVRRRFLIWLTIRLGNVGSAMTQATSDPVTAIAYCATQIGSMIVWLNCGWACLFAAAFFWYRAESALWIVVLGLLWGLCWFAAATRLAIIANLRRP